MRHLTRLALLLLTLYIPVELTYAQQRQACPPVRTSHSAIVVDARRGVFNLNPGAYTPIHFVVPTNRDESYICGNFRSNTPVEVFILDPGQMQQFENGRDASTFYHSGRVIVGSIFAVLQPGEYYLVINNKFSAFARKTVSLGAMLFY